MTTRETLGVELDTIIEAMAFLTCGKSAPTNKNISGATNVRPNVFSGFEIISRDPVGNPELDLILTPRSILDIPIWPLDVTLAAGYTADEGWGKRRWQFSRIRSLDLRDWRGKLTHIRPKMFDVNVLVTTVDGHSLARRYALAPEGPNAIREVHYGNIGASHGYEGNGRVELGGEFCKLLSVAIGASLRRRYYWSVLVSENGGPEARFLTDLAGARAAFRFREVPEGRRRRASLRHWVRQHWRQSRVASYEDESFVREHLRGATQFMWNGLGCRFEPSQVDAERLFLAKRNRGLRYG